MNEFDKRLSVIETLRGGEWALTERLTILALALLRGMSTVESIHEITGGSLCLLLDALDGLETKGVIGRTDVETSIEGDEAAPLFEMKYEQPFAGLAKSTTSKPATLNNAEMLNAKTLGFSLGADGLIYTETAAGTANPF